MNTSTALIIPRFMPMITRMMIPMGMIIRTTTTTRTMGMIMTTATRMPKARMTMARGSRVCMCQG